MAAQALFLLILPYVDGRPRSQRLLPQHARADDGAAAARAAARGVAQRARRDACWGWAMPRPSCGPSSRKPQRALAFMPAQQGVTRWPREGGNLTALVDEMDLPLPDRSVDRVLLVHAIECTEQVRPMLREIWRVMADGGRLIVVAPTARRAVVADRSVALLSGPSLFGRPARGAAARQHVRAAAADAGALHAADPFAAGAAHGAGRRALRPSLARPLRRRQRHRIGQAALCRHRRAEPDAGAWRSCAPGCVSPVRAIRRRRATARTARRRRPEPTFKLREDPDVWLRASSRCWALAKPDRPLREGLCAQAGWRGAPKPGRQCAPTPDRD